MITYTIKIENGDYLWDRNNQQLIIYNEKGSVVIGYICNFNLSVASPIPLNEDILDAIGFLTNKNAGYTNGRITIDIDGCNPEGILVCEGEAVHYVSDIQQICRKKNQELLINEKTLKDACKECFAKKK